MRRVIFLLAAVLAAPGCHMMKKQGFVSFSDAKGGFAAEIPSEWTVIRNSAGFNPGAQFLSPPLKSGKAFRRYMTIDFYPAGDKQYASIDEYVSAHTRAMPGFSHEELASATVAGIPAKELVWRRPLPRSPELSRKGVMATRSVLFAYRGGFFALCDTYEEGQGGDKGGMFERLLKSFKVGT